MSKQINYDKWGGIYMYIKFEPGEEALDSYSEHPDFERHRISGFDNGQEVQFLPNWFIAECNELDEKTDEELDLLN